MRMNLIRKFFSVLLAIGIIATPLFSSAATVGEIQAQLEALQNQLTQLQGKNNTTSKPALCANITFTRNLQIGSSGADVACLQALLNTSASTKVSSSGVGSPGNESMYFGAKTLAAVKIWQAAQGWTPANQVGPSSRAKLNAWLASFSSTSNSSSSAGNAAQTPSQNNQANQTQAQNDQSVTSVVSKSITSVVSIVVTKNTPEYEVVYENPFGNDPFFQGFSIRVPVYKPTGKTVRQQVGAGTGFLVNPNGYIVTNKHVVFDETANYTVALSNGSQLPADIIYRDAAADLAILKIAGFGYSFLTLGNSDVLQLGQQIVAIGNALGQYSNSVSVGNISGLNRTIEAVTSTGKAETLSGVIQTTAAINPGNSGGPLLNLNGEVVGINVAMVQGANSISFAIPINVVKNSINSVVR